MIEERKKRVMNLYYGEGKNTREIASIERMSIRDISAILREEEARRQRVHSDIKNKEEDKVAVNAYSLFDQGKTLIQVARDLQLREPQVSAYYKEYLRLIGRAEVVSLYEEIGDDAWSYLELHRFAKEKGISNEKIVRAVDTALTNLPSAEVHCRAVENEVDRLELIKRELYQEKFLLEDGKSKLTERIGLLTKELKRLEEICTEKKVQVEEMRIEEQKLQKIGTDRLLVAILVGLLVYFSRIFKQYVYLSSDKPSTGHSASKDHETKSQGTWELGEVIQGIYNGDIA